MNRERMKAAFALAVALAMPVLAETPAARIPLYPGLGTTTREVTTRSKQAQKYFTQGLQFLYGFNHGAAIRSFEAATQIDPKMAMAWWGIAFANGPHINFPFVPPPSAEAAWKALEQAQKHAKKASPVEQDLIAALSKRYANPQPDNRAPLDQAFADAMREVWNKYPKDADVGAFFAEALMDLRPWDQWTKEGQEQPGTHEVIQTLDAVLALSPQHPLANHLYIHAIEASLKPERADQAADRLRGLQPGLAHNVHMPSHIDIRRGRWQTAIDTNQLAIDADAQYRKLIGPQTGFLNVYVAHNEHMLTYAAMMTGQRERATTHIRAMMAKLPPEFFKEFAVAVEGFAALPLEVLIRFGRWDEILAEPANYAEYMPFARAFHHAARAIAFAAKKETLKAREEQKLYTEALKRVTAEATFGNNPVSAIAAVLSRMVEGEILLREGKQKEGLAALREAVTLEDELRYDEPPGWMIPVRHSLGAALMKARRFKEAEQVYRQDLTRLPDNGWSLYGLADSLRKQNGNGTEIAELDQRFRAVWARADTPLTISCLCQLDEPQGVR
jgi:tetratricopeptide (TPR) repeat protein